MGIFEGGFRQGWSTFGSAKGYTILPDDARERPFGASDQVCSSLVNPMFSMCVSCHLST